MKHLVVFFIAVLVLGSDPGRAQVNFTEHLIDGTFSSVSSVSAADINGDGLLDILGTAANLNMVAWWCNDGEGEIGQTRLVIDNSFAGATFSVAVDLDQDGLMDVVGTAWSANTVAWWKNDGGNPIQWTRQNVDNNFGGAHEVHPVDLDGDGDMDLLGAAATRHEIAWWENLGGTPLSWNKHVIESNFTGARSVVAVDIDNDMDLDVLGAALGLNDIALWRNNGDLTWNKQTIDGTFGGAHMVRSADIDGDGDQDVAGMAYIADDIAWWANEGGDSISWTKYFIITNFSGALSIQLADIDGDGDLDVMGSSEAALDVRVWYNEGGQPIGWSPQVIDGDFGGAWAVSVADIDGDGDMDLLAGASPGDDVAWWQNETSEDAGNVPSVPTSLALQECYPNPFNSSTMIAYDLPKSGHISLRVLNVLGREVTVLKEGMVAAGSHRVTFDGRNLASGIYFAHLEVGEFVQTRKLMLLK